MKSEDLFLMKVIMNFFEDLAVVATVGKHQSYR